MSGCRLTSIETILTDYGAITPAELQAAARRYLVAGRAVRVVIAPREAPAAPAS